MICPESYYIIDDILRGEKGFSRMFHLLCVFFFIDSSRLTRFFCEERTDTIVISGNMMDSADQKALCGAQQNGLCI